MRAAVAITAALASCGKTERAAPPPVAGAWTGSNVALALDPDERYHLTGTIEEVPVHDDGTWGYDPETHSAMLRYPDGRKLASGATAHGAELQPDGTLRLYWNRGVRGGSGLVTIELRPRRTAVTCRQAIVHAMDVVARSDAPAAQKPRISAAELDDAVRSCEAEPGADAALACTVAATTVDELKRCDALRRPSPPRP